MTTTLVVSRPRLWRLLRAPLRRYFDLLAPRWDAIVEPGHLDALGAALARVPAPTRALDIGTGTGAAAFLVAKLFPEAEVVGIDISPAMTAAAEARTPRELRGRVRFLRADAADLPFPSASFDLITLANAIPFFDEIDRVLAPTGSLLIGFSEGDETPIWVPSERLRTELAQRGFTCFRELVVGASTCLLAHR
jgi:SAM-dependent methyltransferase